MGSTYDIISGMLTGLDVSGEDARAYFSEFLRDEFGIHASGDVLMIYAVSMLEIKPAVGLFFKYVLKKGPNYTINNILPVFTPLIDERFGHPDILTDVERMRRIAHAARGAGMLAPRGFLYIMSQLHKSTFDDAAERRCLGIVAFNERDYSLIAYLRNYDIVDEPVDDVVSKIHTRYQFLYDDPSVFADLVHSPFQILCFVSMVLEDEKKQGELPFRAAANTARASEMGMADFI